MRSKKKLKSCALIYGDDYEEKGQLMGLIYNIRGNFRCGVEFLNVEL